MNLILSFRQQLPAAVREELDRLVATINAEWDQQMDAATGLIKDESITGDQIRANAITADHIQAGTITADKLAVSTTLMVGGGNQITNSEFRHGVTEGAETWAVWPGGPSGLSWSIAPVVGGAYQLAGGGTGYITTVGTMAAGDSATVYGVTRPVAPGQTYQFSGYFQGYRCGYFLQLVWLDAAGTTLSNNDSATYTSHGVSSGAVLTDYARRYLLAVAPANAASVKIQMVATFNAWDGGSTANPYLFFTRLMFAEAAVGQTTPDPWAPGGVTLITGDSVKTGSVTADKLSVTSLSAINANLGTITAGSISGVTGSFSGSVTAGDISLSSSGLSVGGSNSIDLGDSAQIVLGSTGQGLVYVLGGGLTVSGTAQLVLATGGALIIPGGEVSYGANDSAGAGYRLVRVPNA